MCNMIQSLYYISSSTDPVIWLSVPKCALVTGLSVLRPPAVLVSAVDYANAGLRIDVYMQVG